MILYSGFRYDFRYNHENEKKLVIVLCNEWFGRNGNHGPLDSILDCSIRTEDESNRFR